MGEARVERQTRELRHCATGGLVAVWLGWADKRLGLMRKGCRSADEQFGHRVCT